MAKGPSRPSNPQITPILGLAIAPEICKIAGKCVFPAYGPSLEALFVILCSTVCILDDIFLFLRRFRHHLAEEWPACRILSLKVRLVLPSLAQQLLLAYQK